MTSLVHSTALETFGVYGRAGQKRREGNPNRRQRKIRELIYSIEENKEELENGTNRGKSSVKATQRHFEGQTEEHQEGRTKECTKEVEKQATNSIYLQSLFLHFSDARPI